jgi:hypothetical protein
MEPFAFVPTCYLQMMLPATYSSNMLHVLFRNGVDEWVGGGTYYLDAKNIVP